nr:CoA transferase subunit A [Deltaproteobacteria bacterium]
MGLPFMAVHGIHGTDYEGIRRDFLGVTDPYSGEDIIVVPSINPDFCIIHAAKSDPHGNLV